MKKRRTIIILSVSIMISLAILAGLIWGAAEFFSPPNKSKAERTFEQDKTDILLITEYLINSDYAEIFINKARIAQQTGTMFTGIETRDVKIEDEAVVNAIDWLGKRGYSIMDKTENTIYFQRWTRFKDFGSGIAYSINGKDEPELQFLTKLEPLSEDGWYYYEADYNEWRVRNR